MKKILTYMLLLSLVGFVCAACSQGVTVVGNPNEEIALPDAKSATIDYLKSHPIWKASDDEFYNFIVDVDRGVVRKSGVEVRFEISDDGVLSTVNDSGDSKFAVSAMPRDLKKYPLDVVLVDAASNRSADAFASENTDMAAYAYEIDPVAECSATQIKCFDMDGDLSYDGQYFVNGFVQTTSPVSGACGLRVEDACAADGKSLQEAVCVAENGIAGLKVAFRKVECNCAKGRCIDEVSDMVIPSHTMGYCDLMNCDWYTNPKILTESIESQFNGMPIGNIWKNNN